MAGSYKLLKSPVKSYHREKISSKSDESYESIVGELLSEVERVYTQTGKLTDEILSALNHVFQTPLLAALDLVDNESVTMVTCPGGRQVYQVLGSSGTPYTCFTTSNYCSCPAYRFSVLLKEEHSMCKHVLAIKLSAAMKKLKHLSVTDQEMANMISSID